MVILVSTWNLPPFRSEWWVCVPCSKMLDFRDVYNLWGRLLRGIRLVWGVFSWHFVSESLEPQEQRSGEKPTGKWVCHLDWAKCAWSTSPPPPRPFGQCPGLKWTGSFSASKTCIKKKKTPTTPNSGRSEGIGSCSLALKFLKQWVGLRTFHFAVSGHSPWLSAALRTTVRLPLGWCRRPPRRPPGRQILAKANCSSYLGFRVRSPSSLPHVAAFVLTCFSSRWQSGRGHPPWKCGLSDKGEELHLSEQRTSRKCWRASPVVFVLCQKLMEEGKRGHFIRH